MNEELGVILTLLSALFMGMTLTLARRATMYLSPFSALLIPVAVSLPLFVVLAAATGQIGRAWDLELSAYLILLGAGVLQFGVGRLGLYHSLRLLGANTSAPLRALTPMFAVFLGMLVLGERLTLIQGAGLVLLIGAPMVMLVGETGRRKVPLETAPAGGAQKVADQRPAANWKAGVLWGLLMAVSSGIAQFLVRSAVRDTDMALMGALVTTIGGASVMFGLLASPARYRELRAASAQGVRWMSLAGLVATAALAFRFAALETAPVSIVTPVFETNVFFVVLFGYLINRRAESFGRFVILAIVLSVIGTLAVTLYS